MIFSIILLSGFGVGLIIMIFNNFNPFKKYKKARAIKIKA